MSPIKVDKKNVPVAKEGVGKKKSVFSLSSLDALEWLRGIPDESIDLAITDPPYESLEKYRAIGTTTRLKNSKASSNAWFNIFPDERFPDLFFELYRTLKRNTHLYVFTNSDSMFVIKPIAEAAGFKFWKPLVWDKVKIGMGYHYRARYEFILFFEKGKRKLNDLGIPDILTVPRIMRGYPTEKPNELARILVKQSSRNGEMVIDPFMGSGSFGVGSVLEGRNFQGCDICEEALQISRKRITEAGGNEIENDISSSPAYVEEDLFNQGKAIIV